MNRDTEELRLELLALEAEFGRKLADLKLRIEKVRQQRTISDKPSYDGGLKTRLTPGSETRLQPVTALSAKSDASTADFHASEISAPPGLFEQTVKILLFIISCFHDWLRPVTEFVKSYKARGLLPVFILTVIGIALVLAGFGYWMQFVIESIQASQKSMLMGLSSVAVVGVGGFIKRKTSFSEFATAIAALGILLGYSTVHFVGNVYEILSPPYTLLGYVIVTAVSHTLAWRFDTRILVTTGITGIAVMPVISPVSVLLSDTYLMSLLLAVCSGFWFTRKRSFFWLGPLALGFVVLAIEWSIVRGSVSLRVINLSYLIFLCYYLLNVFAGQCSGRDLKLLIAAAGAHIALMLQVEGIDSQTLLACMLINAAFSALVYLYAVRRKMKPDPAQLLLAGMWLALAIIAALNVKAWGIAWGFEGALLVLLSKRLDSGSALYQGQGLLVIGLLFSIFAVAPYFPAPALTRFDGWGIVLSIVLSLRLWCFAVNKGYTYANAVTETRVLPVITVVEAVLISAVVIGAGFLVLGNWFAATVIAVQTALLFRARQTKQPAIDIAALLLAVLPLTVIISAADAAAGYRFTDLPDFAKLATITSFAQLWLWSEFYRRFAPDNKLKCWAEKARVVFYALIPVCWISSFNRWLNNDVIMLLWLSPLLASLPAAYIKHNFLRFEAKLLSALAALVWIVSGIFASKVAVITGFCGFAVMFVAGYQLAVKHNLRQDAEFLFTTALISFGFAVPIFAVKVFAVSEMAFHIAALYWLSCFVFARHAKPLWQNERLITLMSLMILVLSWGLALDQIHFAVIPLYFASACLVRHRVNSYHKSRLSKYFKPHHDLFLHTLAAASYTAWLSGVELSILTGPALAAHAIGILLLTKPNLAAVRYAFLLIFTGVLKIAFVDAVTSTQGEKVLLFVGVGGFILFASFWYQRLLSKLPLS